jgi:hypothetical protein
MLPNPKTFSNAMRKFYPGTTLTQVLKNPSLLQKMRKQNRLRQQDTAVSNALLAVQIH